jgi:hypothetical protein
MPYLWSFGDSWTRGEGVEHEDTFSFAIGKKLKLDVINCGVSGASNHHIVTNALGFKNNFSKDDLIIINYTTPHRDENKIDPLKLRVFPYIVDKLENGLKGYNVISTQAFNPIFGYDYELEFNPNPSSFMEWGKTNNTMVDIITNNWLVDEPNNIFLAESGGVSKNRSMFAEDGKHPSVLGHKAIADKLLTYIKY